MDLENLLAREKDLMDARAKSPFQPFRTWSEVSDYCQSLPQVQTIKDLFDHELGPKSIILAVSPSNKKLLIRGWRQICVAEIGLVTSFLFMVVAPWVFLKLFILLLLPVLLSLAFNRGIWDLEKCQHWTVLLTETGPQPKIDGMPGIPSDQVVQSLQITPDQIDFTINLALVELQNKIARRNAELEALNLIDEGYRNITTPHQQIAEIERRLNGHNEP